MPRGYPGTGPYAGRRRQHHEIARRPGALSTAEKGLIDNVAADQLSVSSELTLERQVERLARLLRRSPAAVKAQLDRAQARLQARQVAYTDLHFEAAAIAAARGDSRPAEWALLHGRSIEPVEKKGEAFGVVVHVGAILPGLGLDVKTSYGGPQCDGSDPEEVRSSGPANLGRKSDGKQGRF
jgi:hypothetical protein